MSIVHDTGVYFDPYDVGINADPYPTYDAPPGRGADLLQRALRLLGAVAPRRRREGAGRLADVLEHPQRHPRHHPGRRRAAAGGVILFEDPPLHTHAPRPHVAGVHAARAWRRSRTRCAQYCVGCLDPLVGSGGFDIITELASVMPMRVIGMLLGIPEEDQIAVRDKTDADLRTRPGRAHAGASRRRSPTATCSPSTSTGAPSTRPTT